MIKKENWKQRVERAKLQLGELIDLGQDPPVRYTAIKCETALLVLEELNKPHISEMKKLLERIEDCIVGGSEDVDWDKFNKLKKEYQK